MDKDLNMDAINKDSEDKTAVKPMRSRRFNRRSGDKQEAISNTWLISFTDVMALMLTFFVLMFSMSTPDQEKWEKLRSDVKDKFSLSKGQPLNRGSQDTVNIEKVNFSKALNLTYLKRLFEKQIEDNPVLASIQMMEIDGGLILSLPQKLLFDASNAQVKETGGEALYALAAGLNRIKNRIEIVGHTDPRAINNEIYPSNWELSLARAANVAGVLEDVGYSNAIIIRGHAAARYNDMDKTIPEKTRLDVSRRVDVVVMEDDGKRLKLFDITPAR